MPTITIEVEEQDYIAAVKAAAASARRWRSASYAAIAVCLLALVWAWQVGYQRESVVGFCALIGMLVGERIDRTIRVARRAKRIFKQNKILRRPCQMSWNSDGVVLTGEESQGVVRWPDFHKGLELEGQFLLFLSDANFLMVPKRAFSESSLVNEFRDVIARRIAVRG